MDRIIIICNDIDWIRLNAAKSLVVVLNKISKIMEYDIMFIDQNIIDNNKIIELNPDKIHYVINVDNKVSDIEKFKETNNLNDITLFNYCNKLLGTQKNSLLYMVFDWLKNKYPKIPIWLVGYQHQHGYEFNVENHYIMKYKYTRIISK